MAFFSSSYDPATYVTTEKNQSLIFESFVSFIPMTSLANDFCSGSTGGVAGPKALYRGFLLGEYVYSLGSPPGGGATDIIFVGYPSADT
jgi:hypothetical protein